MSTELVAPERLLDIRTGELLEATPENAASILAHLRDYRRQIGGAIKECEAVLIEASRVAGTKTLHLEGTTATVYGGPAVDYDIEELARLRDVGLPEERWNELVRETVTYKVDQRVARQLSSANETYARVIDAARRTVDGPLRVKVG